MFGFLLFAALIALLIFGDFSVEHKRDPAPPGAIKTASMNFFGETPPPTGLKIEGDKPQHVGIVVSENLHKPIIDPHEWTAILYLRDGTRHEISSKAGDADDLALAVTPGDYVAVGGRGSVDDEDVRILRQGAVSIPPS